MVPGRFLREPSAPARGHQCDPPGEHAPAWVQTEPEAVLLSDDQLRGAVWQCDCGQQWECAGYPVAWHRITGTRANQLTRGLDDAGPDPLRTPEPGR